MQTHIKIKLENYCAYQERCVAEVRQKAEKLNVTGSEADDYINWLIKENFLNEERYVRAYISGHIQYKKWGLVKIKQALYRKKISKELIDAIAAETGGAVIAENLVTLASQKWETIKAKDDFDKKQKLIRFLLGKGYSYDAIKKAITEIVER